MKKVITVESWLFTAVTLLFAFHHIHSFDKFTCPENNVNAPNVPTMPRAHSANMRINYVTELYTVEVKYATNGEEGVEFFEFKRQDRHVKYITRKDEDSTVFIQYNKDAHPTCKVTKSSDRKDFLLKEDAGESRIILSAIEVLMFPHSFDIYSIEPSSETGVFATRYEGCLKEPLINISISYAADDWKQTHNTSLMKGVKYPEMAIAQIGNVYITILYSYFDPSRPDDSLFQPPADLYCEGFRTSDVPSLPDYFSYDAEMVVYRSSEGIAPIIYQRKIFYDYPSGISRMDFNDLLADNPDTFSELTARDKSIIHDYNAGVQYIFDTVTGKCSVDIFETTFNALSFEVREDNKMLNGKEYFWLNGASTSYNGQFPIRGMIADVYTTLTEDPATKNRSVVSWYFSEGRTRIAEKESVEKNVLLRMYVRPETAEGKKGAIEVNFYNFVKEAPNVFTYDLTSCFNDSSSRILVLTFPGVDSLRGSEKSIARIIHLAIKDATGVRKQRIYIREVIFSGGYMYAEFALLDIIAVKGKVLDEEISLNDALEKLKSSVSKGEFAVKVPLGDETITLKPEPNGLNVFSGDRVRRPTEEGYKEGSVIGLTIGMLILGFILGGVALNLAMSRKFGISLFQKSLHGSAGFGNPLNESSI